MSNSIKQAIPLEGRKTMKIFTLLLCSIFLVFLFPAVRVSEAAEKAAASVLASKDLELDAGDWTAMAKRYPNPYISGDIAEAPSAKLLASWWDTLEDETLSRLISLALKNNRELITARAKVSEARAALGINKAAVLPWLDNVDSWSRSKTPSNSTGTGRIVEVYRLGIDASWEIDIFGGQRQTIKAGTAALEAEYASLHDVWVVLSSEVALNYLGLRTLQERLRTAQGNLALQEDTLNLLQSRHNAGLTDSLALSQAQYTVEQTRATIPPIRTSIEETLNILSILIGDVPGSLEEALGEYRPIPKPDSVGLVGIPADFLRQRPDIRAAERRLIAQIARKKSAQADLWPKFTLIGSIGLESLSSGSLFESDSRGFSFGPRITLPLFHGGAIRKNIQVQTAKQEQYLAAYEQIVLSAVAEVRNALTANVQEKERNLSLKLGVDAARTALDVANDKYRNGLTDFNNVIGAQLALLTLEEQYAISTGQVTSNIVRIFKALGGGWAPLSGRGGPESSKRNP